MSSLSLSMPLVAVALAVGRDPLLWAGVVRAACFLVAISWLVIGAGFTANLVLATVVLLILRRARLRWNELLMVQRGQYALVLFTRLGSRVCVPQVIRGHTVSDMTLISAPRRGAGQSVLTAFQLHWHPGSLVHGHWIPPPGMTGGC